MSSRAPAVSASSCSTIRGVEDTITCLESLAELRSRRGGDRGRHGSADGSAERLAVVPDVELSSTSPTIGPPGTVGNNVAIERLPADGVEFVLGAQTDTVVEPATSARAARGGRCDPGRRRGSVLHAWVHQTGADVGRWSCRAMDRRPGRGDEGAIGSTTGRPRSALSRASALRDVGLFDARYFFHVEDVDLVRGSVAGGWRLAVAGRPGSCTGGAEPSSRWRPNASNTTPPDSSCTSAATPCAVADDVPDAGVRRRHRVPASTPTRVWTAAWRGWRRGWRR